MFSVMGAHVCLSDQLGGLLAISDTDSRALLDLHTNIGWIRLYFSALGNGIIDVDFSSGLVLVSDVAI